MGWKSFTRFWTAEEVPRWFGLSVVLIYLVTLGTVLYVGQREGRARAGEEYRKQTGYAVELLADRLRSGLPGVPVITAAQRCSAAEVTAAQDNAGLWQRVLRDFATHVGAQGLRILDERREVLASVDAGEIGSILSTEGAGTWPPKQLVKYPQFRVGESRPHLVYNMPIVVAEAPAVPAPPAGEAAPGSEAEAAVPAGASTAATGQRLPGLYLEAVLPVDPARTASLSDFTQPLGLVLLACGALFAVYHALRGQLRSVSSIADRLRWRSAGIEQDLAALRLEDERDSVSQAWNQLVDLAHELQTQVERRAANGELSQVLARSGGQELVDALNSLPDAYAFFSEALRIEHANTAMGRLLGRPAEELKRVTLEPAELGPVAQKVLATIGEAYLRDGTLEPVSQLLDVPEVASSYRVQVMPIAESRHEGACVVQVRDVSQQVRADRAREDFVAQVTHELRTPLTNIRAYAETLSSGMFDDPKVMTECYNVITKETRRLSRLVEDILSVSQMEAGTIELIEDTVDLKVLMGDAVRDVRGLADEKDIDLQLVLPAKLEPIRGDRDKLAVVINNLLGNALKYTPAGGAVVVGCQFNGQEVVLTVKDNGVGIAPQDHERVFEKFQRANDPAVQEETGTGIGLYTAREIVRRHGGEISLMSEKGAGTTVIVRLPHDPSRASSLTTAAPA